MNPRLKRAITRLLANAGYIVRPLGPKSRVAGNDLISDVAALLAGETCPTIFDVGANIGQTVEELLDAFAEVRIHAFEPSPASHRRLSERFGREPRVAINEAALSDRAGTLTFHVNDRDPVNDSVLPRTVNTDTVDIVVPATTIDDYCGAHDVTSIDYLKIDAQGFDLHVLRGATGMMQARRIKLFSVEIMPEPMYLGQPTLVEMLTFADAAGYMLVGFYDQNFLRDALNYFNICFRLAEPA